MIVPLQKVSRNPRECLLSPLHVHKSKQEYTRNGNLLLSTHLKAPNHPDWQHQDREIDESIPAPESNCVRVTCCVAWVIRVPESADRLRCTLKEGLKSDTDDIARQEPDISPPGDPEPSGS